MPAAKLLLEDDSPDDETDATTAVVTTPIRTDERDLVAGGQLHRTAFRNPDAIDENSVERSPSPGLPEVDSTEARVEENLAVAAADAPVGEEEVGVTAASADGVATAGAEAEGVRRRGGRCREERKAEMLQLHHRNAADARVCGFLAAIRH